MMRREFDELCKKRDVDSKKLTDEEYANIETVYMYHPTMSNKDQIVDTYCMGGLGAVSEKLDVALQMQRLEELIQSAENKLRALKAQRQAVLSRFSPK